MQVREAEPAREPEPAPEGREEAALRVVNAAEWRNHAVDLDKAKGPKPVAVIERLFTTRYMPLLGAAARGRGYIRTKRDMSGFLVLTMVESR